MGEARSIESRTSTGARGGRRPMGRRRVRVEGGGLFFVDDSSFFLALFLFPPPLQRFPPPLQSGLEEQEQAQYDGQVPQRHVPQPPRMPLRPLPPESEGS